MYAALWRVLPGGRAAKILWCLLLFLVAVVILFVWVFPAVAPLLPFDDVTVATGVGGHSGGARV